MRYKLLIVDLDDTLTPNLGMPPRKFVASVRLQEAVLRAGERLVFSLCTGRDRATVLDVIDVLSLSSPQVIEGGAKIIDSSGKELWAQYLTPEDVAQILKVLRDTKSSFSVIAGGIERVNEIPKANLDAISAVLWYDLSLRHVEDLRRRLNGGRLVAIAVNTDRTGNTVYLTHAEGTKAHGILKLMDLLTVDPKDAIGVGDGRNDIALLESCGLKVAMGNAIPELKAIADFVAPPVAEDGVVAVIEKFILGPS